MRVRSLSPAGAERKSWLFNRIIKDAHFENLTTIADIPKPRRVIPAEDVIIEKPIRINTGIDRARRKVDSSPRTSTAKGVTMAGDIEENGILADDNVFGNSTVINMLVERKVREFEERFQAEKEAAYREGFDQGRSRGFQDGIAKAADLESLLNEINSELISERDNLLAKSEKVITRLVIEVAEAVIGEAVMKSSKELLDYNLKRCLEVLGGSGKVTVRINPSDYEFAEEELLGKLRGDIDRFVFQFEPDPSISPGGCFIESDGGAIDARMESQFEQIKNSFLQLV